MDYSLLAAVLALGGIGILVWSIQLVRRGRSATGWRTTQGRVLRRDLDEHYLGRGAGYVLRVTYQYEVAGTQYRSDRVGFGSRLPRHNRDAAAQDAAREFPPGRDIVVYYNSAHPERAVLEPGVGIGAKVGVGIGILVVVLAAVLTLQVLPT